MEPNGIGGGGLFSSMNSSILGLELPLHQNPTNSHQLHHPQMVSYLHTDPDHHHPPPAVKFPYPAKPKQPPPPAPQSQPNLSDEEEPGFAADDSNGDAKKKISPWQRMKWTDTMVRLLIMAVFYIGDEGGSEVSDHSGKKKPVGLLQKKGKWKSVSRAMMEKGFYVSPQQCEDKFNDLNKRYKRVNDILGKGTACKVVENQNLLDSMDLTPKMKEEVRKLLNSKHLFFREMCAYHNSCRHGGSAPETAAEPPYAHQRQQQQQRCLHSEDTATGNAAAVANVAKDEAEGSKSDDDDNDNDDNNDDSDEEEEEEEEEEIEGNSRGHEEEYENDERCSRKRPRTETMVTAAMQQLSGEIIGVLQDGGKSPWEKKQWMKSRLTQLEEQQVNYQSRGLELEKQRLKWLKFRSKKERDMEKAKLENEKTRLENERMVLMVKQKEIDLLDFQHQQQQQQQQQQHSSNRRGDPSSITG